MILTILIENLNWLVSNKWSIYQESMYATIWKGLWIHGFKIILHFFSIRLSIILLPFLVGWRWNYLDFSLQVVKFKTKFCSSNSGVGNVLTARNYSTLRDSTHQCSVENFQLDLWWVTGFVDGEGCFHVTITQRKDRKLYWEVLPHFKIDISVKDEAVLVAIKNSLHVGQIYKSGLNSVQLQVLSIKELKVIIEHFDKYPLINSKAIRL